MQHWIAFPKLGWEFPITDTLVEFHLFGAEFSIKYYGVLIALGFLLAVLYGFRRAPKLGLDTDRMLDVVLVSTLLAFVGARLYYVLFSEDRAAYFANPASIFRVWEGGLGIYGGIIVAFLSGLVMCKLRKVNIGSMFDIAALGFLIGQGIGRWGNFFNQEAFGGNTNLPWGMTGDLIQAGLHTNSNVTGFDSSLPVHPTFLYESLWCLLGFVLLHLMSKKFYKFKGQIFSSYIIWYGAGRFFIEGLRTDSLYLGSMRVSQLVAVVAVIGGIGLMFLFHAMANRLPMTLEETAPTIPLAEEETETEMEEEVDESEID